MALPDSLDLCHPGFDQMKLLLGIVRLLQAERKRAAILAKLVDEPANKCAEFQRFAISLGRPGGLSLASASSHACVAHAGGHGTSTQGQTRARPVLEYLESMLHPLSRTSTVKSLWMQSWTGGCPRWSVEVV